MGLQEMLQGLWHPALTGACRHQVGIITCHWVTCKDMQSPELALSAAAVTSCCEQYCDPQHAFGAVALLHF